MAGTDYAVVVGISRYPALGDLSGPVIDATNFRDWLTADDGGQVPPANVKLILSPDPDPAQPLERTRAIPTRDQIIAAFEDILECEDDRGKVGRRLYMYLAGHGFAPEVDDAALLMANAGQRSLPCVPGRPYARWFQAAAKFDEIVLFMDCCRDDYRAVPQQPPPWPEEHSPDAANVKHYYVFATQVYQKAREKVFPSTGKVQGVFTTALLAALKLAEADAQGRIWGAAVKKYILNYIPTLTEGERKQDPKFDFDDAYDVVFAQTAAPATIPVHIRVNPEYHGQLRVLDGELVPQFLGAPPPDNLLALNLEPGRYLIDATDTGASKRFDVVAAAGEVLNVEF